MSSSLREVRLGGFQSRTWNIRPVSMKLFASGRIPQIIDLNKTSDLSGLEMTHSIMELRCPEYKLAYAFPISKKGLNNSHFLTGTIEIGSASTIDPDGSINCHTLLLPYVSHMIREGEHARFIFEADKQGLLTWKVKGHPAAPRLLRINSNIASSWEYTPLLPGDKLEIGPLIFDVDYNRVHYSKAQD